MENSTPKLKQNRKEQGSIQRKRSKRANRSRRRRPSRFRKQNAILQKLALERIEYLMETAIKIYSRNPDLAERYVQLARKYSMSSKAKFPPQYKKLICHQCKKLLLPGVTSRHRIQSRKKRGSRYVVTCLNCNSTIHIFFKQKKSKQK